MPPDCQESGDQESTPGLNQGNLAYIRLFRRNFGSNCIRNLNQKAGLVKPENANAPGIPDRQSPLSTAQLPKRMNEILSGKTAKLA